MIGDRLRELARAIAAMDSGGPVLVTDLIPVRLINQSNARHGSWHARARKAKTVRHIAAMQVRSELRTNSLAWARLIVGPEARDLVVRLVYVGPRKLDDDGVVSAVKSLRDGVADALKINDADPRVVWVPDQEIGDVYGAMVEVYIMEEETR